MKSIAMLVIALYLVQADVKASLLDTGKFATSLVEVSTSVEE